MKKPIKFSKYSGAGNDFVIIENLNNHFSKSEKKRITVAICNRNFGVGADGAFFIEKSKANDFSWDFYNDDGSGAEMCLNASRCFAKYAFDKFKKKKISFDTIIGTVVGEVKGGKTKVRIPSKILNAENKTLKIGTKTIKGVFINTGVPHFVILEKNLSDMEKTNLNSLMRHHKSFGKGGSNITYMQELKGITKARTFERGVEDYTLACGTGAAAVAAVLYKQKKTEESKIQMPGGLIEIKLFFNYYEALGPAELICDGLFYK